MDRISSGLCKFAAVLAPLTILPLALAQDSIRIGEDYYGNDINAAVLEASENARKLNHTHRYWYNRSTSESFLLPKLQPNDLEKTNLSGALNATVAGDGTEGVSENIAGDSQVTTIEQDNKNAQQLQPSIALSVDAITTDLVPENINLIAPPSSYQFPNGETVTTQGIISGSVLISTPRP